MRWRGLVLVGFLAVAGSGGFRASAAPAVQIKGKTRIAVDRVHRVDDDFVEIAGRLLDAVTGEGIPNQRVDISLGGPSAQTSTDSAGKFSLQLVVPIGIGTRPLDIGFDGTSYIDAAHLSDNVDPSRAQVTLILRADPSPKGLHVTVEGMVDDHPQILRVALSIGPPLDPAHPPATPDAGLTPLGEINTDRAIDLTRAQAGFGDRRLRATFAGDDARQAAAAEVSLEITAATTTTMNLSSDSLAYEDKLAITGTVIDEDGKPVPRAAITLTAGDRRLAQGVTTTDGTYRLAIEGETLGQGRWGVQVASDPTTPFLRPSRATPTLVDVAAPEPVPVSYTIAAFAATALAAAGFFLARSKPWRRFRRAADPADAPAGEPAPEPLAGGLVMSRPGIVSTLRRAYDEGFSGLVRDTVRGRPVEGAVIQLKLGDEVVEATTGADGTFVFEKLALGDWRAAASADGLITETFGVSIPHRGELRGVRVDLVPVRERVFQLYRRAAEPVLPEQRLWGIWSPRQIVDHVRSRRPSPALAQLTDFVEEIYFSGRVASEGVLTSASERVSRAIEERRPVAPAL